MRLLKLSLFCVFSLLILSHAQEEEEAGFEEFSEGDSHSQEEKKTTESVQRPVYVKPVPKGSHYFVETFDHDVFDTKWIRSESKKDDVDEIVAKYDGKWSIESASDSALDGDQGLVLKSKARHHAISAKLLKPFDFTKNKPFIVQYEVKFQSTLECGGAYVKLLTDDAKLNLKEFNDKTGYTIMFGPDKCGGDSKNHFILRYKHPKTGIIEEKHAKKTENMDPYFADGKTHLYTLIVQPDGRFSLKIDENEVNSGTLLNDLTPSIQPDAEIVDPDDKKPDDWDDREKIVDETATKPDDWDETQPKQIVDETAVKPDGWLDDEEPMIADPTSVKPDDWDDETDGEWEAPKIDNPACKDAPGCGKWSAPLIDNPKYKGKWRAPLIDNPDYRGKWEPRKIPNPNYFEDPTPFKSLASISAVGLELWSMTDQIYFDNFLITDDESVAKEFAKDSFLLKKTQENKSSSGESVIDALIKETKDKPWLWAVYILIVLVPVILIALFCCGKSDKAPNAAADTKKTDEQTVDDKPQETVNEEEGDEEEKEEEVKGSELKKNKDDLEASDNEQKLETEIPEEQPTETKTSPRRRKNRKD